MHQATGSTAIKAGGLDVESGGLRVGSGGLTVQSGGLTIDGGIRLRSGTFIIDDDGVDGAVGESDDASNVDGVAGRDTSMGVRAGGFEVANGGIRATSCDSSTAALSATANARGFGGAVFSVAASASERSSSFRLLQGTVAADARGSTDMDERPDNKQVARKNVCMSLIVRHAREDYSTGSR